jgi:hypothetical protein
MADRKGFLSYVLLIIIITGLVLLFLSRMMRKNTSSTQNLSPQTSNVSAPNISGAPDGIFSGREANIFYDESISNETGSKILPPIPKNKLPISPAGAYPRKPSVPATELQLIQQPAYPALRVNS